MEFTKSNLTKVKEALDDVISINQFLEDITLNEFWNDKKAFYKLQNSIYRIKNGKGIRNQEIFAILCKYLFNWNNIWKDDWNS